MEKSVNSPQLKKKKQSGLPSLVEQGYGYGLLPLNTDLSILQTDNKCKGVGGKNTSKQHNGYGDILGALDNKGVLFKQRCVWV